MRWKNVALVGLATTVSIATAVTIVALDDAGFLDLDTVAEHPVVEPPLAVPAPQPAEPRRVARAVDRFTYAPPESVDLIPPAPAEEPSAATVEDPPLRGTTTELETTDSWLVDVQPEDIEVPDEPQTAVEPARTEPEPRRVSKPRGVARSPALAKRLAQISPTASKRLWKKFNSAKAAWPPEEIALVAIKDEKLLELFARPEGGEWQFVHGYPVLAASGGPGPKLRQGDKQVPEGVYRITLLNPNSRYHVSLRVNYPNDFDRQMAKLEGRSNLGGDIMIHGKAVSAGCLAVGDEAAEELFVLAAHIGLESIKLIIAPTDFRRRGVPSVDADKPKWLPELYTEVASAMSEFKSPPRISLLSLFGN